MFKILMTENLFCEMIIKMSYYRKLLTLGLPIVMQQLISTSLNMVDTIMISQQGDTAIAAVSIANKLLFIMIVTLFGLLSGKAIYFSQYYGINDMESIHKLVSLAIIMGAVFSGIFTIGAQLIPRQIISLFISDDAVIVKGSQYLKIVSISYIPMSISFALSTASRNVHKTLTPMLGSTISLGINTFLNFLLINGNLGFPALGVKGAAIATLISRLFELLFLFTIIYVSKNHPIKMPIYKLLNFDVSMFKKVMPRVIPVVLNEASWVVGTTLYFVAYGRLGTSSVAAVQISNTAIEFSWALFMGIGGASAIQIGNAIGRGELEESYSISKKAIRLGVIVAVIVSFIYIFTNSLIVNIFNLTGNTATLAATCIIVMAIFIPVRQYNYMTVVAVFRSGGDTTFCMLLDLCSVWLIGLPLTFLAVIFTTYSIPVILAISSIEECVKIFIVNRRFKSRKWINNVVVAENDA